MDFAPFDSRRYPVVGVADGYDEWSATYEQAVCDEMDRRLLERVTSVRWPDARRVAELACGTGRTGAWLRAQGAGRIDGVDLSAEMLRRARDRGIYRRLTRGDLRSTPFPADAYDLVAVGLADEHLPALAPLYAEAARLLVAGGRFVNVGYHPQFLMTVGMPTHFHRPDGSAVAIETHVHLPGDHVRAAADAGLRLVEMHERVIDDDYVAAKPKWSAHRGTPVSFVQVWRRSPHARVDPG
ncbi:MAG: class I SAM-dependent DNA methyltransferase [Planctomycetota bacterium]|jgi:SAM-dependent methyltransferase